MPPQMLSAITVSAVRLRTTVKTWSLSDSTRPETLIQTNASSHRASVENWASWPALNVSKIVMNGDQGWGDYRGWAITRLLVTLSGAADSL